MNGQLPFRPVHAVELLPRSIHRSIKITDFPLDIGQGGFRAVIDRHRYFYAVDFFSHRRSPLFALLCQECSLLAFFGLGFQRHLCADKTKKPLTFGQLQYLAREFPLALEDMMQEGRLPSRLN
ncbi:hypothetical protein [Paenibacillus dendritiformis]|uniref:hypothetical protein n=1 Tax=Paenibacillus dendritiformis TaxID=130049 RepID=UPI0015ECCA58|nr:hypothetical protein [Paenibacillus dendritiformis]